MKLCCLVVLVAACGGPSRIAGGPHNDTAPPSTVGPPPTVTWVPEGDYGELQTAKLPAVAFDGSRVVYADSEQGPGDDPPNLTLHQRDRGDREVDTLAVTAPDFGIEPPQLDAANERLARSNQPYGWTALTATPGQSIDDGEASEASAGGIEIHFDLDDHVVVREAGKVVVDETEPGWEAPPQNVGTEDACSNPAYLEQAYIDAAHHLALVEIAYQGTDSCWEPAPQLHVIAW